MKTPQSATYQRIPVVGFASAGIPTPCDMWSINGFRYVRSFGRQTANDKYAAVKVSGDCLNNVGIYNGDYLIFRFTPEAAPGDLVIASTPFGQTIKFLFPKNEGLINLCTDKDGLQIHATWLQEDINVQGVVIRVERDLL